MGDAQQQYYTVDEFVEELKKRGIVYTDRAIRKWIAEKRIKAIRPGKRQWHIPASELDRILRGDWFSLAPAAPFTSVPAQG